MLGSKNTPETAAAGGLTSISLARTPVVKLMTHAQELVNRFESFNVASISTQNQQRLLLYATTTQDGFSETVGGVVIRTKEVSVESPKEMASNPEWVKSGMDVYIDLHFRSKILAVRERTQDVFQWNLKVWNYPNCDKVRTCDYIHEFITLYAASTDWVSKFDSETSLRDRHFLLAKVSVYTGLGQNRFGNPQGGDRQSGQPNNFQLAVQQGQISRKQRRAAQQAAGAQYGSGAYGQPSGGKGGGKGAKGGGKGGGSESRNAGGRWGYAGHPAPLPKFCASRLEPGTRCQKDPKCPFDHHCPSCGAKHSADRCDQWDAIKAQAVNAAR